MSKFDTDRSPGENLFWFLFWIVLIVVVLLFGCKPKQRYIIICFEDQCDTVNTFDYPTQDSSWIHYHKKDGTDNYIYKAKIDTIK